MKDTEKQKGLHTKLSDQKGEYLHKMKVIEEIKLQKQRQQEQDELMKDIMKKKEAENSKFLAQNFKDQKAIDRLREQQIKMIEEAQKKQE